MSNGHSDKLIFECPVLDAALLFQRLHEVGLPSAVKLREPSEAHLTLLFLGDPEALASEIADSGSATAEQAGNGLRELAGSVLSRGDKATTAQIQRSAVLNGSYLVLVVEPDDELQALRDEAWGALLRLLGTSGIEDPLAFLMGSRTVRLPSPIWIPHVTLAKDYRGSEPSLGVKGSIEFGPVRLHR